MTSAWDACAITKDAFVARVYEQGERARRDLPWRHTTDAYAILVSEVMLQQTQVSRVYERWVRWMQQFPTVDSLAAAAQSDVLAEWQGLGYNRRALALKRACDECSVRYDGKLPERYEDLVTLPGIGPATASGVIAFAHNKPAAYIETNVRTVFMTDVFPHESNVGDKTIAALLWEACPKNDARGFYTCMLDYGAHLKALAKAGDRSVKQGRITRQSTFEGSRRQKRAELVRNVLAADGITREDLFEQLQNFERNHGRDSVDEAVFDSILTDLLHEGFFYKKGGRFYS